MAAQRRLREIPRSPSQAPAGVWRELAVWQTLDIATCAQALIWVSLAAVLSRVLLPFIKGGVMAAIFLKKAKA